MEYLKKDFKNREDLINYVKITADWSEGEASDIIGGNQEAIGRLNNIDPINYAHSRNFGDGNVTILSPYISHAIINVEQVRKSALKFSKNPSQIIKFIQQLAWRDFWYLFAEQHPECLWNNVENYKTGYGNDEYSDILPEDIKNAKTGVACIDDFIDILLTQGYLHNHARMYLASYIIHFRKIKWQAGAKWFLEHLLDGDEASNNLSWQWIASTFSNKPYIFNLENVKKYFDSMVDTSKENNKILDKSYQELQDLLFPRLKEEK